MSDPVDPSRLPRPIVAGLAAERERTIALLQDAAAVSDDDAFDLDMLEERLELAMKARSIDELRVLTRDLPAVVTPEVVVASSHLPAIVEVPRAAVPERAKPKISAIFSSVVRRGRRVQPAEMDVRAVFGSVVVDLREASFQSGVTTLRCKSVFGSVEVLVPPHVRVEMIGSGIFGSFEEQGANDLAAHASDAPILRVEGKAVFASVEVQTRTARRDALAKLAADGRRSARRLEQK